MRSVQQFWRGGRAFSLIELLAVIAVIGILAALLLPALSHVKSEARRIECVKRQGDWVVAFHQYTDDYDGWIPREGYFANGMVFRENWVQVQSTRSRDTWYNALPYYLSAKPAASYFLPSERFGFYERNSLFHCPAARFPEGAVVNQAVLFSIAMNSQLINPPSHSTVQFSRIKDTARTALFIDNLLEEEKPVVPQQEGSNLGQPSAYANRFAGRRHRRSGNVAFAGGHVLTLRGEKVVETKGMRTGWDIIPAVDVLWELEDE